MKAIALFCLLTFTLCSCAQTDTILLKRAETLLQNTSTSVSEILSDKKYLPLHPETSFRELIKKHSTTDILKIVTNDEPGKEIKIIGIIKNKSGQPVEGALTYLYQTDAKGWYAADAPHVQGNEGDHRHARLFGYVKTDKNGKFELHTIKPSGYPKSDLPAHIHVQIVANGYQLYGTEFLFDDDERLVGQIRENSIKNRFLIGKPEKTTSPFDQQFTYNISLEE